MTPLAVVGLACEYPEAPTPEELWDNVLARRQAFRRIPRERLRVEDYLADDRTLPDSIYSWKAAVLEGYDFDRVRFRVAGGTYRVADLAHWLALDVADRALTDAGFPHGEGLPADATGVVLGNTLTGEISRAQTLRLRWPYVRRTVAAQLVRDGWTDGETAEFLRDLEVSFKEPFPEPTEETLAGGLANTIAGRIANHFDLGGGGFTVDGACSSSLLALTQAAAALTLGDVDVALAGGVDLSIDPFELVGFARTGALAEGAMRVFDARPTGFIPGEGCGFAVLMRLDDALAQGCRIRAVIRGWGMSSDGSGGITRPEVEGQRLALRRAYRRAGFDIDTVGYFEGHGTGTPVGDETELAALTAERRRADAGAPPVPVGSVKANIGHTKAAAGVAAFIKACMALERQVRPPNTGCDTPHPLLVGEDAALRALPRGELWPEGVPLRAGVSSMGFGGINVHVVVEAPEQPRRRRLSAVERERMASHQDAELLLLTAPDRTALREQVGRLRSLAPRMARSELADLAAELARRAPQPVRAAVVAREPEDLVAGLETLDGWLERALPQGLQWEMLVTGGAVALGRAGRPPRLGLLFPGQASPPYRDGGAWVLRFPRVAELYRRLAESVPAESVLAETMLANTSRAADAPAAGPLDTSVAQPVLVTASCAALAVLEELGLEGSVAVGHSLGELPALAWAGAIPEAELLELARARGRAMSELGDDDGAMASIAAPAGEVAEVLPEGVGLAGSNSPRQTIVSGSRTAVEEAAAEARRRGWAATLLPVSHAFHSPLVAAAAEPLEDHLAKMSLAAPRRPVVSTVSGESLGPDTGPEGVARILLRQITEPVRFQEAVAIAAPGVDLWLEVGSGRVLSGLMEDIRRDGGHAAPVLPLDAGGASLAPLLGALGAAYCLGAPVAVEALFAGRLARPFPLDRQFRFIANPCEEAPEPGALAAPPQRLPAPSASREGETAAPTVARGAADETPLEVVRALVAARAELPPEAVKRDHRLLSDLHLNSISVGQLVVEAARGLGLSPPASPSDYANATVGEVAGALTERLEKGDGPVERDRFPAGIDAWVRPFTVELRETSGLPEAALQDPSAEGSRFELVAPAEHPLGATLPRQLETTGRQGVALVLPASPGEAEVALFLAAARDLVRRERQGEVGDGSRPCFLVVQEQGGGGGFARSLYLEHRDVDVVVVDLPLDHPRAAVWVAAEVAAARGYAEACYDDQGRRRVPHLAPLPVAVEPPAWRAAEAGEEPPAGELPLGPEDVLLVTGGGKGIAAECALSLARSCGCRLALVGRSRPKESEELHENLERMARLGVEVAYFTADVTDARAVRRAIREVTGRLGPVTGVLHSAGTNDPRLVAQLEVSDLLRTVAPKVLGLRNVLAAVEPDELRMLVTFGSIIARLGMAGEADYALANEWLTAATERFARQHPECRCLALEWSVWSGVGMGERLGRLESLAREGITAIPPDLGVAWLETLLRRPGAPVAVVVTGRFGEPPTLAPAPRELPFLRFLDRLRVHYPGIELVVDVEISQDTDPYLEDHVFHGERLFPAVLGLEAMAQVAATVVGAEALPVFEDVALTRPVVVPDGESLTVRVAALVRDDGDVDVALRSAATGFTTDHFRARCRFDGRRETLDESLLGTAEVDRSLALSADDLYGGILFQGGRFQRLSGYLRLLARECRAEITPDGAATWFARHLPAGLLLGDPAVRDATLHGIQPSIPHATILPVGVDRLIPGALAATEPYLLAARERQREGDLFVYDVEVQSLEGRVVERWEGLRLRAVERLAPPDRWRIPLVGPYLERRLEELVPGLPAHILMGRGEGASSEETLARLLSEPVRLLRRPDGKPEVAGGPGVTFAHDGDLVLAVAGEGPLGCDLEAVTPRDDTTWRDLLGLDRFRLAEAITAANGGDRDAAATRVWAALESLKKAGRPAETPLTVAGPAPGEAGNGADTDDGWLLLEAGECVIGTVVLPVEGREAPLVLAVLTGRAQ